ncbi:DEAD/DEAH box helicase family protein [Hymenobacter sp. BT664]|uniref:DEAD/DEAH box helicase family protein n=1 Tax=Hymenobacter montanus TaxID=2771359 RepID=A0A927GLI5_9BACT|nr:DEAD/DEAH box helicase family protein [Hymenobacter montanus]MBD2770545.1 DEAD/DEAH box helicase family protein [Hymenobacter montanus]
MVSPASGSATQQPTPAPPAWSNVNLWPHQVEATQLVVDYLTASVPAAALVRMPTGSGKTAIMAAIAQLMPNVHSVLVVAPWVQLTKQLKAEIAAEVWRKLGITAWPALKSVYEFRAAEAAKVLIKAGGAPAVFVCTNQSLERLHAASLNAGSKYPGSYAALQAKIDLVLVDEGHREPAPQWAKAVRSLGKPTVLFTATPYRNDHRLFNIADAHAYQFLHQSAVAGNFIRHVEFREVSYGESPQAFIDALLHFFTGDFQSLKPSAVTQPRVIVRCATSDDIREVTAHLRRHGHAVVEVHDNFSDDDERSSYRTVPDPGQNAAVFWVHQNKLIEGIDDPAFCLLAVYQPLANSRALIQQVGRILRNPGRQPDQQAYVFSHPRHKLRFKWQAYVAYEAGLGGGRHEAGPKEMFARVSEIQNHLVYLDGNYRERFSADNPQFHEHLAFRLTASIFRPAVTFSLIALRDELAEELDEDDYVLTNEVSPEPGTIVLLYAKCHTSPLLFDQTFLEFNLGYAIIRQQGGRLFFYNTSGATPAYLLEHAQRVAPEQLERLLPAGASRVSQVSLLNSDLGNFSVRRRSLSARAVESLAPGLADYAHFCSTVSGTVNTGNQVFRRRYVGFTRGRVTQLTTDPVHYRDYIQWLDEVATELDANQTKGADLFNRYAAYCPAPVNPQPSHILLDMEDIQDEYVTLESVGTDSPVELHFDDTCADVTNDQFECRVNNNTIQVRLLYHAERKRFELVSSDLAQLHAHQGAQATRRQSVLHFLNARQAFRIIIEDGFIYAHGQFFKSRLPLWGRRSTGKIDLVDILIGLPALANITSEKGIKNHPTWTSTAAWQPGSLFNYIDDRQPLSSLFQSQTFNPDILICDDLGNELADFIAVQLNPPRIALIHAKYKEATDQISASAFHEVCGQAVKNLGVLNPQWDGKLKDSRIWTKAWKLKDVGQVSPRTRVNSTSLTGQKLWQEIHKVVRHPSATREVWIVMGDGMSKQVFERERLKPKPKGQIIQFIYLLHSTWSSVSAIGGLFKVFCRP